MVRHLDVKSDNGGGVVLFRNDIVTEHPSIEYRNSRYGKGLQICIHNHGEHEIVLWFSSEESMWRALTGIVKFYEED